MSNGATMTSTVMRHHVPMGIIGCYAPVYGLLPKYSAVSVVNVQDQLVWSGGGDIGKSGRRGEVRGLEQTCMALEAMLGVALRPPKRLE
jgi:hypothetical protein